MTQSKDESERPADVEGIFRIWVDTDLKVRLLVFFHENPGMIETIDGLARRLGLNKDLLAKEIADHVRLGILRERPIGEKKVIAFNRGVEREVEEAVRRAVEARMEETT